jgi:hypothetical protein
MSSFLVWLVCMCPQDPPFVSRPSKSCGSHNGSMPRRHDRTQGILESSQRAQAVCRHDQNKIIEPINFPGDPLVIIKATTVNNVSAMKSPCCIIVFCFQKELRATYICR